MIQINNSNQNILPNDKLPLDEEHSKSSESNSSELLDDSLREENEETKGASGTDDEVKTGNKEFSNEKTLTFPLKLMAILSNEEHAKIIAWLSNGESFCIYNKKEFTESVLPRYFKKSKFASFTRKLHRWQFIRISKGPKIGTYHHHLFKRDNVELCTKMTCLPQVKPPKQNTNSPMFIPFSTAVPAINPHHFVAGSLAPPSLGAPNSLMSMMAHSQETRRNLMYQNQLVEQQRNLLDSLQLQQQNHLNNVLHQQAHPRLLQSALNPSILASRQQQLLQQELSRLMESRSTMLQNIPTRNVHLSRNNDVSNFLIPPNGSTSILREKIARVELEIASLQEARLKQLAETRQAEKKRMYQSIYGKQAVRSDIRRASAA